MNASLMRFASLRGIARLPRFMRTPINSVFVVNGLRGYLHPSWIHGFENDLTLR